MDENSYKTIRVRSGAWADVTYISAKTGEPKMHIVARLAAEEKKRLNCTHSYPGGAEYCALCGASRKD